MRSELLVCFLVALPVVAVAYLFDLGGMVLYAGLVTGVVPPDVPKSHPRLVSVVANLAPALVVLAPLFVVLRTTERFA